MKTRAQPISSADRNTKRARRPISAGDVNRKAWAQPIRGGDSTRKARAPPISGANRNSKAGGAPPPPTSSGEDCKTRLIHGPDASREPLFSARREERLGWRQGGAIFGCKINASEREGPADRERKSQGRQGKQKKKRPPWGAGPGAAAAAAASTSRPSSASQFFFFDDERKGGGIGGGGSGGDGGGDGGGGGGSGGRSASRSRRRLASSSSGLGSPVNRRLPSRCSKAAAASLGSSSALKKFLPTWTSLAAEAVWLRGSCRGGADAGAIGDRSGGGGGGGSGNEGIARDCTKGNSHHRRGRSRRSAAADGVSEVLTSSDSSREREDVWAGHRGSGLRLSKGRAGAAASSSPVPEEFSQQAREARKETMAARDRRGGGGGGGGGDGRGRGLGRGRGVPAPSLDPCVERKLMDWLKARIDRCARTRVCKTDVVYTCGDGVGKISLGHIGR